MNTRKVLAILLAMLVAMGAAACSKKSETTGGTEVQTPVETPTETPSQEDEKPAEGSPAPEMTEAPQKTEAPAEKPTGKPTEKPAELPKETPAAPVETPAPTEAPQPKTDGQKLLADFMSKAGSGDAFAVAEALSQNSLLPFMTMAMPVEPGLLSGFGNTEIHGFSEGAMFGPMIGAVPFIGYVFTLEDGTDASSFISTLKGSADLRWNICVEAEEMTAGSAGNKVFFVMCNRDLNSEE